MLKYTQLVQKYAGTDHNQKTPVDLQHFVITSTQAQAKELVDSLEKNTALTDKVMAAYLLELKKMQLVNATQYETYIAALRKQAGLPPARPPVAPRKPGAVPTRPAKRQGRRGRRGRVLEENLRAKYTEFLRES